MTSSDDPTDAAPPLTPADEDFLIIVRDLSNDLDDYAYVLGDIADQFEDSSTAERSADFARARRKITRVGVRVTETLAALDEMEVLATAEIDGDRS